MWRRRLALVVVAAAAVACDTSVTDRVPLSPPAASPLGRATLVVGLVGTLSGPDSWRGEDAFEGADLGVHELNRTRPPGLRP